MTKNDLKLHVNCPYCGHKRTFDTVTEAVDALSRHIIDTHAVEVLAKTVPSIAAANVHFQINPKLK